MRSRPHEIKIRLNDKELDRLNKMVARTHFDRETFLRLMLEGGLLEGWLVEDEKKTAINISPTLDGLEYLEKLRKRLRNA